MGNKFLPSLTLNQFEHFGKYYDLLYPEWEKINTSVSEGINKFINTNNLKIKNIMDLGCGTGIGTIGLAGLGYKVVGLDISSQMLKSARKNACNTGRKLKLIQGDMRNIKSITNHSIDLILCRGNSICYLKDIGELRKLLKDVYSILNNQGIYYIGVRDWSKFLSEFSPPIIHLSDIRYSESSIYDCFYNWVIVNNRELKIDVSFNFYDVDKSIKSGEKNFYVNLNCFSIEEIKTELYSTGFKKVWIENVPEERMDGEEYTIICGMK